MKGHKEPLDALVPLLGYGCLGAAICATIHNESKVPRVNMRKKLDAKTTRISLAVQ